MNRPHAGVLSRLIDSIGANMRNHVQVLIVGQQDQFVLIQF